jgi:ferredoxin
MPALPADDRIKSFEEVNLGYGKKEAFIEAWRCLNCGSGAVVSDDCTACLNCVIVCPYGVPTPGEHKAQIDISQCQACGICAAECPASAIDVRLETKEEGRNKLDEAIAAAKKAAPDGFNIEFFCEYQQPEENPGEKADTFRVGKPCLGRIDIAQLLRPFEEGSRTVRINKCKRTDCRFKDCEQWIVKHVQAARNILRELGMDAERLKLTEETGNN